MSAQPDTLRLPTQTGALMYGTLIPSIALRINKAGFYPVVDGFDPQMICSCGDPETFSAPDWESLAFYAENYPLCDCLDW
jgi:hypothetical protein